MVEQIYHGKDGKVRHVEVKYRNASEKTNRKSHRAVRELVLIHPVDELDILSELHEAAARADVLYCLQK